MKRWTHTNYDVREERSKRRDDWPLHLQPSAIQNRKVDNQPIESMVFLGTSKPKLNFTGRVCGLWLVGCVDGKFNGSSFLGSMWLWHKQCDAMRCPKTGASCWASESEVRLVVKRKTLLQTGNSLFQVVNIITSSHATFFVPRLICPLMKKAALDWTWFDPVQQVGASDSFLGTDQFDFINQLLKGAKQAWRQRRKHTLLATLLYWQVILTISPSLCHFIIMIQVESCKLHDDHATHCP